MKVLISNWVYNWGSTGYILRDLGNGLKEEGVDVLFTSGFNPCPDSNNVFTFSSDLGRKVYWPFWRLGLSELRGSTIASKKLIHFIEKEKPDMVNLHLLHGNILNLYYLLSYLGEKRIKTVLTHHAEIYYTGTCGYAHECNRWLNMQCEGCPNHRLTRGLHFFGSPHTHWKSMNKSMSFFSSNNLRNTAVSPWLQERVLQSPVFNRFVCDSVMNGIDTELYKRRIPSETVRNRLGDNLNRYALYVSANFNPADKQDIKGGYYIVELARMLPEVTFVIVATSSSNCKDLPKNILFWGKASSQTELAELYSNATVTVLTSKKETFSMICAETLCCGTPVIGFKAGGPETIALSDYSRFVDYSNLDQLKEQLQFYRSTIYDREVISKTAIKKYSRKAMTEGYLATYNKLLSE